MYALSPQYHDHVTLSDAVTSCEPTFAVAVSTSPGDTLPLLSSVTEVTLTEPAAAILFVARVV